MRRGHGGSACKVDTLRENIPDMVFRTTFIGPPGETAADFAELEEVRAACRASITGVFRYSHERTRTR
ncbi:MAG: hypothetical protein H6726_30920 [Sandaracinaceae bacterium]|nr:hypothetical protein [Sandaracinaceae bacterium]